MQFLNNILKLSTTIQESDSEYKYDDLELIASVFVDCSNYIQSIMYTETIRMFLKFTYSEVKFYQEALNSAESSRSSKHDIAMMKLKMLNRLCEAYKVDLIFTESQMELPRAAMADQLIKPLVDDLFLARKK